MDRPLPGHPLYPGLPAPSNARLSLGQNQTPTKGASTTIRLVGASSFDGDDGTDPQTPQLRPFETAFDLNPASPGPGGFWAASPAPVKTLYPSLAGFETYVSASAEGNDNDNMDMPGTLGSPKLTTPSKVGGSSAPFVFGSPLPQNSVSNVGFSNAAASVLAEMNKRLAEQGVEGLGVDILERKRVSDAGLGLGPPQNKPIAGRTTSRFDRVHDAAFSKMDGIDKHYAAKRNSPERIAVGIKRKSDAIESGFGKGNPGGKRNDSGARVSGTRAINNDVRKKIVPGSEDNDDLEEEEKRRQSKRPKFENGLGVSIAPPPVTVGAEDEGMTQEERDKEAKRLAKEREVIKRKLELNKQRRRSSMGRPSMGGRGVTACKKVPHLLASTYSYEFTAKPKTPTSKFGFLSSAKSLVQSVWAKRTPSTKSSRVAPSKPTVAVAKTAPASKNSSDPSASVASKKSSTTNQVASGSSTAGQASLNPPNVKQIRSPIPTFGTSRTRVSSTRSGGVGSTEMGPPSSTRTGKSFFVSSIGTRKNTVGGNNVSSLGTRGGTASPGVAGNTGEKRAGSTVGTNSSVRGRTSSRLLAPTVSSLAKAQGNMRVSPSIEQASRDKLPAPTSVTGTDSKPALRQVTNSPAVKFQSPNGGKISNQPLSPSAEEEKASLEIVTSTTKPPVSIKPKVLPGRKPRISRSKVIARLASQRATSGSSAASGRGKTPSSIRTAKRRSLAGTKLGRSSAGGDSIMMTAKRRVRQNEFARRRGRATTA